MVKPYSAETYLLLKKKATTDSVNPAETETLMKNLKFYPYTVIVANSHEAPCNTQYDLQSLLE